MTSAFFFKPFCVGVFLTLSACTSLSSKQAHRVDELALPDQWDQSVSDLGGEREPLLTSLLDLVPVTSLKPLVELGLDNNPSLKQTAISLQRAGLLTKQRFGERLPVVDATIARDRIDSGEGSVINNHYSAGLSLSWELDVWGRLADGQNAAVAQEATQRADYDAAKRSLSARILQAWINLISQQQIIAVEQQRLSSLNLNERVIRERYRTGLGNLQDMDAARSLYQSAQAGFVVRKENFVQSQRDLNILLGNTDWQQFEITTVLPEIVLPNIDTPASALGRRPDLMAAYARVQAADSNSDIAYKALLPSFSLRADFSDSSGSSSELLKGSPAWNLLGNLTAPLFRGGSLRANLDDQKLAAEQAYWKYREVLHNAILEVEGLLGQERVLGLQAEHLQQALLHARNSETFYRQRYRQGLVDITDLLSAQQTAFDLDVQVKQVRLNRLSNRIDVGVALGLGV